MRDGFGRMELEGWVTCDADEGAIKRAAPRGGSMGSIRCWVVLSVSGRSQAEDSGGEQQKNLCTNRQYDEKKINDREEGRRRDGVNPCG